jgi:hypothetical protein
MDFIKSLYWTSWHSLQTSEPTYPSSDLTLLAAMKTKRKTNEMGNRTKIFLLIISPPHFPWVDKTFKLIVIIMKLNN